MNILVIIVGCICLIIGFIIGMLLSNKKNDFVSSLAEFIIFAKQQNKPDELINKVIKNLSDLMLKGCDDFTNDPKAANARLQQDKKDLKDTKALIRSMQKTINNANNLIKEFSWKSSKRVSKKKQKKQIITKKKETKLCIYFKDS